MAILRNPLNPDPPTDLFEFTQGIDVDRPLAPEEIKVQIAWANALKHLGFLSSDEYSVAEKLLNEAELLIRENRFEWKVEDEDIHMNLERFLTEKAGELGKKIHFGRSRNDLIATTLRLFCAGSARRVSERVMVLLATLLKNAKSDVELLIPGQTHLQHGQPIRLAHFWLAHAEAFRRDVELLHFAESRALSSMPLGAGALSGVSLEIPLESLSKQLGFLGVSHNSYDSVADRDFMLDLLRALSSIGLHLSRMSEDIIFYASSAVGLFILPKDYSTGSSMMPNKRNPDVAELSRAKAAHLLGALNEAGLLMKGLPLSYNSDLHEMKRILHSALGECEKCLRIYPVFIGEMKADPHVAQQLLARGHILATHNTEEKVKAGASFRSAYTECAAEIASQAGGKSLSSNIDFAKEVEVAVEMKTNFGGTARRQIEIQIQRLSDFLKASPLKL